MPIMPDIVERLRSDSGARRFQSAEAADEIEKLRALLRRIDNLTTWETHPLGRSFQEEVEAALPEFKDTRI